MNRVAEKESINQALCAGKDALPKALETRPLDKRYRVRPFMPSHPTLIGLDAPVQLKTRLGVAYFVLIPWSANIHPFLRSGNHFQFFAIHFYPGIRASTGREYGVETFQ